MALYKILTTPGREEVDILAELGEDIKLDNQDVVKVVLQRLRAKARKEKRRVDFVASKVPAGSTSASGKNGQQASSLRVTEAQRQKLAKFIGWYMYKEGQQLNTGEAVSLLVDEYFRLKEFDPTETEEEEDDD